MQAGGATGWVGSISHSLSQELREERDRAYNMITIIAPDNSQKNVYFDISMYYRRIGNPNFPKPPT